jgi:hypothetical protein
MHHVFDILLCTQGTGQPASKKELKTEANKKRKQSLPDDGDNDESSQDWWTKYFASIEAMIEVINFFSIL